MKHFQVSIILSALFLSSAIIAEPQKSNEKSPEDYVNIFFDLYRNRSPVAAADYIFANNPYIFEKQESVQDLKTKIGNLEKMLGKERGFFLVQNRDFGGTIRVISYIVKYDRQPLRFIFVFYKPADRWLTYQFNFDNAMDDSILNQGKTLEFRDVNSKN